MRRSVPGEDPLYWVGSSKRDRLAFPEAVQDLIGAALSVAQFGGKHPDAKSWKGEGPGVLEVVERHDGNAYRAVYVVRFAGAVYVLHCFQRSRREGFKRQERTSNSSRSGSGWLANIMRIDMVRPRAESGSRIVRSSGNVFSDLGFRDADERQMKVRLTVAINEILRRRHLSQGQAAQRLGINQPKVSALSKYKLEGFSVERLMRFLTSLDQDVEIIIRNKPRGRRA